LHEALVIDEVEKEAARRKKPPGDRAQTQAKEFDLWKTWKEGGEKPDDFRPLLQSMRPLIRSKSNFWASRVDLPPETVHAEFNKHFVKACRDFDPNKGTQLGTWVTHNLRKAQRWVAANQDPTRVQETRYYKLGQWDNAHANLTERYGREPTTEEMAMEMGMSPAEAGRMQAEKRGVLYSSGYTDGYDPTTIMPSRETEILNFIIPELSTEEKLVYEYTVGYGGKPQLKPGEIAQKLGYSPSKVTRLRQAIDRKIDKYI